MSSEKKPDVVLTHEEAQVIRNVLDTAQIGFPAMHAKLIGGLYEKLPAPDPKPGT